MIRNQQSPAIRPGRWLGLGTLWLGAFLAAAALVSVARAEGDAVKGKENAIKWCARCHVIGDHNVYGGINSTPSFYIMSEKPESYRERVLTFQQRRPHLSMKFDLKDPDVENILAYILTLERP